MITRVITVLILSMTFILLNCQFESQPTQNPSDLETQNLSKKPKPGNKPNLELITFTGDMFGYEEVLGCCPNAGPNPAYTLELFYPPFPEGISGTPIPGYIFMSPYGHNMPWDYKVVFWWIDTGTTDTTFIGISGGDAQTDKRNKITTVTFEHEPMTIYYPNGDEETVDVSFVLTRARVRQ
jgi:hypothetical protein